MRDSSPKIPPDTPLTSRKRALIVGASSGIGAALAVQLGREGFILALLARREEVLRALADRINTEAGEHRAFPYPHDVTDFDTISRLFQRIHQDLKRLDLVIYSAGAMPRVNYSEYNMDKDRTMIDVNLIGAMGWLGQAATLFERKRSGQIVGISSTAGDRGRIKNPGYHASKAGLTAYLESLRNRLTRHGVHVLTVKPGVVDTPLTQGEGGLFMAPPELVAKDIVKAIQNRRQVLYTPARWRLIMWVVRNIPSVIFRHLNF